LKTNLENLLKLILENELEFVLIGGYASVVYGSTMVTQDLDICMALTTENIASLRTALKGLHPIHRMNKEISFDDRPRDDESVENLYLQTDSGGLDIISMVTAVGDFTDLKKQAVQTKIYGHTFLVISIEDLIRSKEAVGRPKDIIVANELREILLKRKK
jgi:predicted nucleotidyltransferase